MIGVLVSGEGTNLQALLDAGLPVVAVASNVAGARALVRAEAAGVPTAAFELEGYPDRDARDRAMADWLESPGVELVVLRRLHAPPATVVPRALPAARGQRPPRAAPRLPRRASARGRRSRRVRRAAAATVHFVDDGIDTGEVIASESVPVLAGDTVRFAPLAGARRGAPAAPEGGA